jgi:TRAP-type uncharacterized transport system fused permease subunit
MPLKVHFEDEKETSELEKETSELENEKSEVEEETDYTIPIIIIIAALFALILILNYG